MKKWYKFTKDYLGQKKDAVVEIEAADAKALVEAGILVETIDPTKTEDATAGEKLIGAVVEKMTPIIVAGIEAAQKAAITAAANQAYVVKQPSGGGMPSIVVTDRANVDNNFGYEDLGTFARDVKSAGHKEAPFVSDRLKKTMGWGVENKQTTVKDLNNPLTMNTQSQDDGGILIPPGFSNTLYQKVFEEDDLLQQLDTYNIAGNSMIFPRLTEDSRATGSRYGGVRAYWVDEGGKLTASRPHFDKLTLTLKKLAALVYTTSEQLEDTGMALEQFLMNGVSSEMKFMLGDAIINGDAVGKPLGILNSKARVTVSYETSQLKTIQANNISKMWARCQVRMRQRGYWFANQEVEPQLDTLALAIGTGGSTSPMYLMPGGLTGEAPAKLKGRPVRFVEWMPALGTEGDLTLFDPSSYCFMTKGGIKTAMSMHLRFDFDEMVFRFTYRCDGQLWWPKPLTPYKGTNTLAPVVTLQTRPAS